MLEGSSSDGVKADSPAATWRLLAAMSPEQGQDAILKTAMALPTVDRHLVAQGLVTESQLTATRDVQRAVPVVQSR